VSILSDHSYQRLAWRGSDVPGEPVGVWFASGTTVGDASGGAIRVRFNFGHEGDPISGDYFNVEQLSVLLSTGIETNMFLTTTNMTPGPQNAIDRVWQLRVLACPGIGQSALRDLTPKLPIFIGARLRDAESVGSLTVGGANPTATDSLSATAMGYIWEGRSLLAPGGLQRPVGSIFG